AFAYDAQSNTAYRFTSPDGLVAVDTTNGHSRIIAADPSSQFKDSVTGNLILSPNLSPDRAAVYFQSVYLGPFPAPNGAPGGGCFQFQLATGAVPYASCFSTMSRDGRLLTVSSDSLPPDAGTPSGTTAVAVVDPVTSDAPVTAHAVAFSRAPD